ncbi:hypothetical protein LV89_03824 [Arcicella aurantiaca]|uniref:Uncharacterized protein n=1 Tax=Arcicella aurantiaca TaxID=591202 RepID=A0A316DQC6_9BACT|nr:hypothetical protein [Arcicella aurantiaca]PWK20281.1 hypothetical protein LV89_03824 [Arcicella aurantiaca]
MDYFDLHEHLSEEIKELEIVAKHIFSEYLMSDNTRSFSLLHDYFELQDTIITKQRILSGLPPKYLLVALQKIENSWLTK